MKGYKGIPKQHHKAVRVFIGLQTTNGEKVDSPQTAYRKLSAHWEQQAAKAKESAEQGRESRIQFQREAAAQAARQALKSLATVRDTLCGIAHDRMTYLEPQDFAEMAHALMVQAGSDLESALFVYGVVKADKLGGTFTERFPKLEK